MTTPRLLPRLTDANRAYWTGGADGRLHLQRCVSCRRWVNPPVDHCPSCGGELVAEPVSGRGTIFTFTVNHQEFRPEVPPPYVIAILALEEQDDLRVVANIVGADPDELRCGLGVQVAFEQDGDHHVPVFRVAAAS